MANQDQSTTLIHRYGGEFYPSKKKLREEIFFFVHFYFGHKKALRRHIEFVNSLGYDAFAFNLQGGRIEPKEWIRKRSMPDSPISASGAFGIKNVYADQIEALLNCVAGKKIMFSFSNVCASAVQAMARRYCSDIKALICDSGPSSNLIESTFGLLKEQFGIESPLLRTAMAPILAALWDPEFHKGIHRDLEIFPEGYPVLSIRGWEDRMIPPYAIDAVFEPHKNLQWQKLSLPKAGHLLGLKKMEQEYKEGFLRFLSQLEPE